MKRTATNPHTALAMSIDMKIMVEKTMKPRFAGTNDPPDL
jgi:hypothetical protein